MKNVIMLVIPIALAAIILAVVGKRGISVFKKQGVAWGLTVLMIFAAIGIGYARAPASSPVPEPYAPGSAASFVWDEAGVLSDNTIRTLDQRNERLWERHQVTIGVVTCNYGRDDLGDYAIRRAEDMGLGGYDMIVVLDISGDSYWLFPGSDIGRDFTDDDCTDYAWNYMENEFVKGNYSNALLKLTKALEDWYNGYFA